MNTLQRLSVPGPGRTISSSVRKWVEPLLNSFHELISSAKAHGLKKKIATDYRVAYSETAPTMVPYQLDDDDYLALACSAILSMWMILRASQPAEENQTLLDAERWFLGERLENNSTICQPKYGWPPESAIRQLSTLDYNRNFRELFPYILEEFEVRPEDASNADEYSDFAKRYRRHHTLKKTRGLFYTPSDVAEFIADLVIEDSFNTRFDDFSCLDPACGTGIILLAVVRTILKGVERSRMNPYHLVLNCIYGMDISLQAIQSCTFSLLLEVIDSAQEEDATPAEAWRSIRKNLTVVDSTIVDGTEQPLFDESVKSSSYQTLLPKDWSFENGESRRPVDVQIPVAIEELFPRVQNGFKAVVGNPPYSRVPNDRFNAYRRMVYLTAPRNHEMKSNNLNTLFTEMMWKFTNVEDGRAAIVVPLSIAYHGGRPYRLLRREIQRVGGAWDFYFFDRTPDSLFGDDIRTRNAIISFRRSKSMRLEIGSTQLTRWTSRNRYGLFKRMKPQKLDLYDINSFIPKIGTKLELMAYKQLKNFSKKSRPVLRDADANPRLIRRRAYEAVPKCVFFYSTAYNWLPIFRTIPVIEKLGLSVPNSLGGFSFMSEEEARFFFTMASSRFSYWLWRVEGDGFHLTKRFLRKLPFDTSHFTVENLHEAALLGQELWDCMKSNPVVNRKRGIELLNFSPLGCTELLDRIDLLIINQYGIDPAFGVYLKEFINNTIVVGRENEPKYKA